MSGISMKPINLLSILITLLLACDPWNVQFVQTDDSFRAHARKTQPQVYVDRLPALPYRPVGLIEVIGPSGRYTMSEAMSRAHTLASKLGCDVVVASNIHKVSQGLDGLPLLARDRPGGGLLTHSSRYASSEPPQYTIYTPAAPPERMTFVCGIWKEHGESTSGGPSTSPSSGMPVGVDPVASKTPSDRTGASFSRSVVDRPLLLSRGAGELRLGLDIESRSLKQYRPGLMLRHRLIGPTEGLIGFDLLLNENQAAKTELSRYYGGLTVGTPTIGFSVLVTLVRLSASTVFNEDRFGYEVAVGFPVKYRLHDRVSIVGLERVVSRANYHDSQYFEYDDTPLLVEPDAATTGLSLGGGAIVQVLSSMALTARTELRWSRSEFGTLWEIPMSAELAWAPNKTVDLGTRFTWILQSGDVRTVDPAILHVYGQLRF